MNPALEGNSGWSDSAVPMNEACFNLAMIWVGGLSPQVCEINTKSWVVYWVTTVTQNLPQACWTKMAEEQIWASIFYKGRIQTKPEEKLYGMWNVLC